MLDLRAKARRLHAQEIANGNGGLALIVIDYIQLMRAEDMRANRVEQVGQMSRGLKILARELKVPVIALSQLSRAPEQRTGRDKRPILSDLRESGNLEQDADLVCFIYREDYYKNSATTTVDEEERAKLKGIAELIVRKNRNGPIDTVELAFQEQVRLLPEPRPHRPRDRGCPPRPTSSAAARTSVASAADDRAGSRASSRACPLGVCDGSGWVVDDDDIGPPCECRERRIAQARMRGVRSVLPTKYQGVCFDRPPVSDMARDPQHARRWSSRSATTSTSSTDRLAEGRGLWLDGRRRHRQDDAGDAGLEDARSRPGTRPRSTRCRGCSPASAAPTTAMPASSPTSTSSAA